MSLNVSEFVSKLEDLLPKFEAALPTIAADITKVENIATVLEAAPLPAQVKDDLAVAITWLADGEKIVTLLESVLAKL